MIPGIFVLALLLVLPFVSSPLIAHRRVIPIAETGKASEHELARNKPDKDLREILMDKFHAMDAANRGIFQDDISAVVAPYFPPGQPFDEVRKTIERQKLGSLQPFRGKHDAIRGAMYVTRFSLMTGAFSEVYIVLDLDFTGETEADMVLQKAGGFIRGSNM